MDIWRTGWSTRWLMRHTGRTSGWNCWCKTRKMWSRTCNMWHACWWEHVRQSTLEGSFGGKLHHIQHQSFKDLCWYCFVYYMISWLGLKCWTRWYEDHLCLSASSPYLGAKRYKKGKGKFDILFSIVSQGEYNLFYKTRSPSLTLYIARSANKSHLLLQDPNTTSSDLNINHIVQYVFGQLQ